jgi:single-strand DNA-binding protein
LQTRKWQDQSGQEKYTTEVVLQRFRGELTLLDSRGGGAESSGFESGGADFGSSGPSAGSRERKPAMAGGGGRRDDMDDEIPF